MRFDDSAWQRGYSKWGAYGMSKLANLLFTYELARRARVAGIALCSVAAHPGYSSTNLQLRGAEMANAKLKEWATRLVHAAGGPEGAHGRAAAAVRRGGRRCELGRLHRSRRLLRDARLSEKNAQQRALPRRG